MKRILVIVVFLGFIFNATAQKLNTSRDSIDVFYNKLFSDMKNGYIFKDKVDWLEIEPKVRQHLGQYSDFQSSLKEVTDLFDFAKANHCRIFYNHAEFSGTNHGPTTKDFSEQWVKKFTTKPGFEAKVLDNEIGYILIPGMLIEDNSSKNIHNLSQPMYDAINKIKSTNNIKGWIIDLRFNTGGNCRPMLLALYDFLGDNDVWSSIDINGKQISRTNLKNGKYMDNGKKISYINPKGVLLDKAKVAVITNLATGSSGEVTALAFKDRENTIFIGEKTNGMTTTNINVDFPFGAYMTLTVGYDCDRNGKFYKQIIPDILISRQDDFDNLLLDNNIREAINYLSKGS